MASEAKKPLLPGKLAKLPFFEFSPTLPKSHADQARTDVIYGVDSLGSLLREGNFRLGENQAKTSKF